MSPKVVAPAAIVTVVLAWLAIGALGSSSPTAPQMPPPADPTAPHAVASAPVAAPLRKAEATAPGPDWIIGNWVVNQASSGCRIPVAIAYADRGLKLSFKGAGSGPPDIQTYRIRSSRPPVLDTTNRRYEQISAGRIQVTEHDGAARLELSKCDT
jgi:hypothetical protein